MKRRRRTKDSGRPKVLVIGEIVLADALQRSLAVQRARNSFQAGMMSGVLDPPDIIIFRCGGPNGVIELVCQHAPSQTRIIAVGDTGHNLPGRVFSHLRICDTSSIRDEVRKALAS